MNESVTGAVGTAAFVLASWTTVSPEEAQILYDGLAEQHPNLISSKVALAQLGGLSWIEDLRVRLVMALCRAAEDAAVLPHYCQSIVGRERANGRQDADLSEILGRIKAPGTAHAVVDRAKGLIPTTMFGVLDRLAQATGFVEVAGSVIGTALLVRRDVIITCAHVAFEPMVKDNNIATEPPVRNINRISFPVTPVGPQDAKLSADPVLTHSQAHMISVGKLDRLVTEAALNRLDFALLRLDRSIDRVQPIDLAGKDVTADGRLSFLIGFPGRHAAVWDADTVVRSEAVGGRLIHMINSVPGMSGGCVIGDTGVPIGIHEGSIPKLKANGSPEDPVNDVEQLENRAVLLKAVSKHINTHTPDLLKRLDRQYGPAMYEEALVTRLGRRGAQLLADPSEQSEWTQLVGDITRAESDFQWTMHPWFTDRARERIEKWFVEAASTADTNSRVAFINGPRGSGKTFMIDVLKRFVVNVGTDLIRIAWSEGETTLETLARHLASTLDVSGTRTAEGHERYENVPAIVTALANYGMPDRSAIGKVRPLFIAIDAGDETGSITEPKNWIELVGALSRQPWARIVLCGLPKELKTSVEDAVPREVTCEPFQIDHVRSAEVVTFLERFGMVKDARETPQAAGLAFEAPDMPHKARQELTTSMAALFAIGWHRAILPVRAEFQS